MDRTIPYRNTVGHLVTWLVALLTFDSFLLYVATFPSAAIRSLEDRLRDTLDSCRDVS
jgi:hypothetical protein